MKNILLELYKNILTQLFTFAEQPTNVRLSPEKEAAGIRREGRVKVKQDAEAGKGVGVTECNIQARSEMILRGERAAWEDRPRWPGFLSLS